MMPTTSKITISARIEPEDRVRADFYALFARLFFSPPDAGLLRVIGSAPLLDAEADAAALAIAWARLSAAARVMDPQAASDEYEALFGGVGHSALSLFGSFYAAAPGTGGGPFLVELRTALAGFGLGLREGQNVPEDHLSAVFETMRLLIQGNATVAPRDIEEQHRFFAGFIGAWCPACCAAISANAIANFYKVVAECMNAFVAIEDESFAIA